MRPAPRRPGNSSTWSVMRAPAESTSQKTGSSCAQRVLGEPHDLLDRAGAPRARPSPSGRWPSRTRAGRRRCPVPVTTPSAGRSRRRVALASSASSTNEPSSSSRPRRSRTNSLFCRRELLAPPWPGCPAGPARRRRRCRPTRDGLRHVRRMARMATSSVERRRPRSRAAASSSDLHSVVDVRPGSRRRMRGDAVLAEQLLAVAGLGEPVGVEQHEVADVERRSPATVVRRRRGRASAAGRSTRSGRTSPSCHSQRRRVAGRRVAQRARGLVEHDDAQRDELLGPALGDSTGFSSSRAWAGSRYWRRNTRSRYLTWKAVIDGSMPWPATSPMTAASRVGAGRVDVVEVAGHQPGAGLVHPADLEARDSRAGPRAPGGRPSAAGASSSWSSTSSARRSSRPRSSARRASARKRAPEDAGSRPPGPSSSERQVEPHGSSVDSDATAERRTASST